MKRICMLLCLSILLVSVVSIAYADTPIVSGQVVTGNGVTRYIYTVTNILLPGNYIGSFERMAVANGDILQVLGHNEPAGWNYSVGEGDEYCWFSWNTDWLTDFHNEDSMLAPGQSAVFEIFTSAPVTTQWTNNWLIGFNPSDDRDFAYYIADRALPIPVPASVPEPSSILALLGGLASVGGFTLRQKK